ncbi:response regulator transcription factor [Pyxidicoccus sp. MSG2]|uniref:response regulator transcription factor n=1 Tax=Pyxidicoccus sp. MSG2 TaxID=2996790 RepID=UPI00226D914D|nr:response regulator [Pyxidicoccus sp. MSG2]MCY1022709.1 response regulator [Pyxidicoccus sp. MSG2]
MKILIVEDDEDKRRQVSEFLKELAPDAVLQEARSMQSGLSAILKGGQDLLILDMTMPTFDITAEEDGGRPQAYAGRELLRHMKRRGIRTPAIVLTQFDRFGEGLDLLTLEQLDTALRAAHAGHYLGAVFYSVTDESWKAHLEKLIRSQVPAEG